MENQFDDKPEEKELENSQTVETEKKEGPVETTKDEVSESPIERPYQRWQKSQEEQRNDSYGSTGYSGEMKSDSYEYTEYQNRQANSSYQQNSQQSQGNYGAGSDQGCYNYQNQNQNYQNTNYQNQQAGGYREQGTDAPMSLGDWLLVMIAGAIPCVGQILYIVWAFSSSGNINRRNYCRAALILMVVVFVLYLIFGSIFAVGLYSSLS